MPNDKAHGSPRHPLDVRRVIAPPLLSICIITRNRALTLEKLLDTLSTQLVPGVEICISDNASTDSTADVVRRFQHLLPLRYQKNDHNLGGEQNVLAVGRMAQGEFVWFMGDDDGLQPGALSSLVEALVQHREENFAAVYLNAAFASGTLASHFGFEKFQVFPTSDLSPIRQMTNLTFLGSVCLRRSVAQSLIREGTRIVDGRIYKSHLNALALDEFPQVYLFLESLRTQPYYAVMPKPMQIILGYGEEFSYGRYLKVQSIHLRYAVQIRQYYPQFPLPIWFTLKYVLVAFLVLANARSAQPRLEPLVQAYRTLLSRALTREGLFFMPPLLRIYQMLNRVPFFPSLFETVGQLFLNASALYSRARAADEIGAVVGARWSEGSPTPTSNSASASSPEPLPSATAPTPTDPSMDLMIKLFPPTT